MTTTTKQYVINKRVVNNSHQNNSHCENLFMSNIINLFSNLQHLQYETSQQHIRF